MVNETARTERENRLPTKNASSQSFRHEQHSGQDGRMADVEVKKADQG